jgi:hypothetical protein
VRAAVLTFIAGCGRIAFDDRTFDAPTGTHDVGSGRTAPTLVAQDDQSVAAATSATSALPNVVAGHLIILAIGYDQTNDAMLAQVTSSSGDQLTILGPADGGTDNRQYLAYGFAVANGPDTFTAMLGASSDTYFEIRSHEYADVDPANPLDQYVAASGVAPIQPNATLVTTTPNDLLFAYVVTEGGSTTAGAGFTAVTTHAGDLTEDAVATDPGSHEAVAVVDTGGWTFSYAAFRGD